MATESFTLDQELKRRRSMILSLVGGVVVTTLAVSNDRALFSQAVASAGAPPVAYAFVPPAEGTGIGGLARSPGAARNFVTPRRAGTTGTPAGVGGQPDGPVAFAVQTPGDAPAAGTVATPAASSFAAPGAAPGSSGGGQQFAGNPGGDFGGSSGGVGGSAVAPTDPATPPGTTDPTTPPGTTPPGTTDPTTPPIITDPTTPPGTTDPGTPGPVSPVPEPATWLMMILGFGLIGAMLRRARRSTQATAVSAKAIAS